MKSIRFSPNELEFLRDHYEFELLEAEKYVEELKQILRKLGAEVKPEVGEEVKKKRGRPRKNKADGRGRKAEGKGKKKEGKRRKEELGAELQSTKAAAKKEKKAPVKKKIARKRKKGLKRAIPAKKTQIKPKGPKSVEKPAEPTPEPKAGEETK
jgi:hypothetical protein